MDVSLLTVLAQAGKDQFGGGGPGDAAAGAAAGAVGVIMMLIYLAIVVLWIAGMWKSFAKAGKPGWAAIVPIYNIIVMLEITGKPIWWIVLFLIPCVNIVMSIIVHIAFAERFGQGAGFGLGLAFLPFIFFPILGFGGARYLGVPAQVY